MGDREKSFLNAMIGDFIARPCHSLFLSTKVMAEKGCESCSKWQEHYYRGAHGCEQDSFLKLMTGDFAHGISIPEKFAKSFNGQFTKGFNLKVPSRKDYYMCKHFNNIDTGFKGSPINSS
ncbi:hypothetical protein GUJ93_ZPchr0009g768 [Zizania palustris]|uniref:Uncharacterized protein n=1 Tax=Zizania palustris TaxID=103762 RepID=A0A8J5RH93_ZIZPA|nr:hypothetical protein GUJ93_ZPchr0009g768 [Zizania palustris]